MSTEDARSDVESKMPILQQVSLCDGELQVQGTPKVIVELETQRTPVKQIQTAAESHEMKHSGLRGRKRSANALSQRVPVQEVVRELTNPIKGKYPTGVSPKQLLAYILTMPEQQRPAVRKNWLQVAIFSIWDKMN